MNNSDKIREIVLVGLFAGCAIAVNIAENMLPTPLPGIKLGAANIFSLAAIVLLGTRPAFAVTFLRVIITWLLTGNIFAFICSMAGAPFSTALMALLYRKFGKDLSLPWISAAGAWAFNIGQVAAVTFIIVDKYIAVYILPLFIAGSIAGWAVGKCAEILCKRIFYNKEH